MAERSPRAKAPLPLECREPDEIIRVVRAFKEMGARLIQIGSVRVQFDPFESANQDSKELTEEQAKEKASQNQIADAFWSS